MNKKTYIIFGILIIALLAVLIIVSKKDKKEEDNEMDLLSGKYNVELKIKEYGIIQLELDADTAPITVTNFIKLVNEKHYDGLKFHRIIDDFMIQGGNGDSLGRDADTIKGEFSANGVENNISHVKGVISMARNSISMDSASDQFFIVDEDSTYLDGQYAAFGHVTSGIEVVEKVAESVPVIDNNGTVLEENQPVIDYIKVID